MKKLLCIPATALLILSVVLSGCGEDADQRNASAPQQQKNVAQQQKMPDPFEKTTDASTWP
ncbi:MAG: hypothetical protein D3925_20240, partial [Candidatus Electrothrix sp. AR5]|nr:hypothetical protein [Candidatus Electrothrix sp. AR5]